jgi:hypothetical protein
MGNREKSHGAKSGENGEGSWVITFPAYLYSVMMLALCAEIGGTSHPFWGDYFRNICSGFFLIIFLYRSFALYTFSTGSCMTEPFCQRKQIRLSSWFVIF